MMDREDVIDLLAIIQANDHRTVGDVDVELWQRMVGNYTRDEAVDAIMAHIRDTPGVWLEPGHVVARVKAAQRDAYERSNPDFRDADRIEAMFGADVEVRYDRYNRIDKSEPDEPDYPSDWTSEQRVKASWAKLQARRDQSEYEDAIRRPGALLIKPPASDEARAKAIQQFVNRQMSFDDVDADDALPYVNPLLVRCSYCKAAVGAPCLRPGMPGQPPEPMTAIAGHPSRIEAAARAAGHPEPVVDAIVAAAAKRSVKRQRAKWSEGLATPQPVPEMPVSRPADAGNTSDGPDASATPAAVPPQASGAEAP
jgi:hypothetical protein